MPAPRLTRGTAAFLIATPLAWAGLLWFHPDVDPNNVYRDLRHDVTAYQIVHIGTLVFIGLMGLALYLLVRDLPGKAARLSRLAIGAFVLLYGAYEAVIGLAIGALVQHTNDAPPGQRPVVADAIQSVGSNAIVGDPGVVASVGALAWIAAVIAAAVAVRRAGAPLLATVLLAPVPRRGLPPAAHRTHRPRLLRRRRRRALPQPTLREHSHGPSRLARPNAGRNDVTLALWTHGAQRAAPRTRLPTGVWHRHHVATAGRSRSARCGAPAHTAHTSPATPRYPGADRGDQLHRSTTVAGPAASLRGGQCSGT